MSTGSRDSVARLCVRVSAHQKPHVRRHCPRCATARDFASSGKFRVNAHRKTVDAWLIFRCTTCDYRWNLPIHERRQVKAVDPVELEALMRNDPALADRLAGNASSAASDVAIALALATPIGPETSVIAMEITVTSACAIRLDRLLASILGLRRNEIAALSDRAALCIAPPSQKALRRTAVDGQWIQLDLALCPADVAMRCRKHLAEGRLNIPAPDRLD
jgi:hypothetical protein